MNILEASTEPLAHRVAAGLTKISLAIKSHAWKEAGKSRVTPLQAQTLSILRLRQDHTATVSAIAEELAVALPTASEVVRNLEEKGWLKKQRSSKDARIVTVTLSPKGRRKAEEAGGADFLTSAADLFQPADQVSLLRMLITMIRTLQERGEIPVARMCVTCKFFRPNIHKDGKRPHHCAFVDAPFGDRLLRIECADHEKATKAERERSWKAFMKASNQG